MSQASRPASSPSPLVITLARCALFALAAASGCSRSAVPEMPEEFPESYAESAVLRSRNGNLEKWEPGQSKVWEGLPASIAPAAVVVTALDGRSAVIAVNRAGLTRLRIDPESRKYRLDRVGTGGEFPGRSVGGLFRREDRVFCLLYRDSVFEKEAPKNPPSLFLSVDLADPGLATSPYDLNLGEEGQSLFSLFPLPEGFWILQLRKEVPEGVESVFRSFDPETGILRPLERSDFERKLMPRPLSAAPEPLRRAALLLAPEGCPVVVSASLADGSRAAYSFGDGRPEDTVELRGAVTEAGAALIAWNAVAAVARAGSESAFRLPAPEAGTVYRDVVPLEGAILALWEVGVFPNIEESGAVLLPAP